MNTPAELHEIPIQLSPGFTFCERLQNPRRLAYKEKRKVWLETPGEDNARVLFTEESGSLNCPLVWRQDGSALYHSHRQIYAIDVETAKARAVTRFRGEDLFSANWVLAPNQDGTALVFQYMPHPRDMSAAMPSGPAAPRLCAVRLSDGKATLLYEATDGYRLWKASAETSCNLCAVLAHGSRDSQIWTVGMDDAHPRLVATVAWGVHDIALSPDGVQIACWGDEGIFLLATAEGARRQVTDFGLNAAWSPHGSHLAFMDDDHALWRADLESDTLERLAWFEGPHPTKEERKSSYSTRPVWSSDGRLLWFRLTKTGKQAPDAAWIEKLEQSFAGERFALLSKAQREEMRRFSIEQASWAYSHRAGVVDLATKEVWTALGSWSNAAWSPVPA